MSSRDMIGKRGEFIACTRLLAFCGRDEPYFNPHPLGEKCPTFDLLVELVGVAGHGAYFLAQVKATTKGSGNRSANLRVEVGAGDVARMVRCPFPTYLIGVDEPREAAYIVSVHGTLTGPISSMPRSYPLNARNLARLWSEVTTYWGSLGLAAGRTSQLTF